MRLTVGQFLVILAARWRTALLVFLGFIVLGLAASLLMPKRYTATAAVLIDIRSPDPVVNGMSQGMLAPGYMATQVEEIQSERVTRRVIHALDMDKDAHLRSDWADDAHGKGDFEAWLTERLQKRLDVTPSREANVITIGFSSPDPARSARVAEAFMQSYIDTALELKVEPARAYNDLFDARARQLRDALEAAQSRLSAYEKTHDLINNGDRLDVENQRLTDLSSQLVTLQATAAQNQGKRAQAASRPAALPEVLADPAVLQLSSQLSTEQAHLQELQARYGESNPDVSAQRARIDAIKAKYDAAVTRAAGALAVNTGVTDSQVADVQRAIAAQRARVMALQGLRDEASVYKRDVDNAQAAYTAVQERVNQMGVESQNTRTNVSVLKHATEPASPSSPKLLRNLAVAIFLGAFTGIATALMRELRDRRMRTAVDVEHELRQPLLMVLPVSRQLPTRSARTRTLAMKSRVLLGHLGGAKS
jgi:succinoglycan biosynthesis transport protein ExoP